MGKGTKQGVTMRSWPLRNCQLCMLKFGRGHFEIDLHHALSLAGTTAPAGVPLTAAAPPPPQAATAAAGPAKAAQVDILDELFAAPAAQPAAASDFSSFAATAGVPAAAVAAPGIPVQQAYAPMASVGSTGLSTSLSAGATGPYGSVGMQAAPMSSIGSVGFTSTGSWAPGGLHPAASVASVGSTGPLDNHAVHGAAIAAAAGGASLGFDDSAFGPVDDWRVMGDVQQWHRALLTKEKVSVNTKALHHRMLYADLSGCGLAVPAYSMLLRCLPLVGCWDTAFTQQTANTLVPMCVLCTAGHTVRGHSSADRPAVTLHAQHRRVAVVPRQQAGHSTHQQPGAAAVST